MECCPPALVLAAGFGTRLRPLSLVRAKPAMPVAGEALIRRILANLVRTGVRRAVVNLHHLPETICAAVGDGADLGLEVRYSWENPILGSAGGPRRALPLLEADRFLVVNADTLTDVDVPRLLDEHARSGALATIALIPNPAPERYGGVLVGEDGEIAGFVPRGARQPTWHFIGVQAVEARAFAGLPPDAPAESVAWLYPALMREHPGSIRAFRSSASFLDIGTAADYLATCLALAKEGGRDLVGARGRVAPTARLARTILWDDVVVEDDAELIECVVADRVRVPAGLRARRRAIVVSSRSPAPGEEVAGDLILAPITPGPAGAGETSGP